ncbi:MAG TPA: ABC transporter substrate-binding protein [Thermodesulfobacteriota bacterium]
MRSSTWALVTCAVAAALLGGGRPSRAAEALEKELVIVTTGGAFERALRRHFYEPFTRATGVTIRSVAADLDEQWAKVKAMSRVGRIEWDIVSMGPADVLDHRAFLAKLDCWRLPNAGKYGVEGACQDYSLLRTIGGGVLAYDAEAFPHGRAPQTWADFWDVERFPGPRALMDAGTPWWVLMAALMADGVPPDRLFPLDLDRAFRKLDEIKPHVKVWWRTGDQSQQIMRSREVVMAMMWSGRALSLKAAGVPIEVSWKGAPKDVAPWGLLAGAPHPKAALAFLDFFMGRPEAHLAFSREVNYDTSNQKALDLLPEPDRLTRPTHPDNWRNIATIDYRWVSENRARLLERWSAWLAK